MPSITATVNNDHSQQTDLSALTTHPCDVINRQFFALTICAPLTRETVSVPRTNCPLFSMRFPLDSAPRSLNGFLSALSPDDYELIRPHLRTVELSQELVLVEVDNALKRAYLPHRGVISLVVKLARGEQVQVAMIGRDSIFGAFAALGDPTALNSAIVLIPGLASTLEIDRVRAAADRSATFREALARHGLAVHAQIQQTAGCNASHTVESRLARCLLHTRDLSGSDKLVLTQESMAQMIGARRNSVSLVANMLQQANFIRYSRGHIELSDAGGLSRTACECYATVRAQYERLLGPRRLP